MMTKAERCRAARAVSFLVNGAPSYQVKDLPAVKCNNDISAYDNGEMLTDTLASWVSAGFLAGPFKYPPLPKFRVNPLKVVVRNGKVRPVLNVSSPLNRSFNDNVCPIAMEKVVMSSAKQFSFSLLEAGKDALMSKSDKSDAYKNVPCNLPDLRLQGLEWGGRYFVELDQIFGSKAAASNYDTLDNTTVSLAKAVSQIPRKLVHRQLDDTPSVGPARNNWAAQFASEYREVCSSIGMKLAPNCPDFDKAFTLSKKGKVLGICFDSSDMSWHLPSEKRLEYMNMIVEVLDADRVSLQAAESLLGKLAFVCTMAPYLKSFKINLQLSLACLKESGEPWIPLSAELSADLFFWWAFLKDSEKGLPVVPPPFAPPLRFVAITTDAAGWKAGSIIDAGLGAVVLDEDGVLSHVSQFFWEFSDGCAILDSHGKQLGCKTTCLELTGLIIPLLLHANSLSGKAVVCQVDNVGCHFIHKKGYSSTDVMSSILARLLCLLAVKFSFSLHVVHLPRLSSWDSCLADRLTRKRTTSLADSLLLQSFPSLPIPLPFLEWMRAPYEDWSLPVKVLNTL